MTKRTRYEVEITWLSFTAYCVTFIYVIHSLYNHIILFMSIVGNLGIFRPELFVFPEAEYSCVSDNGKITFLILADISSHKQLVTVTSRFYVCLAVLVGTGIRSTCPLMWYAYQEQLMFLICVTVLRTVSSLRQSISRTLDNKLEHTTHNTIIHHYSSHILIYISNLHISYLYTHNCLYYILCFCFLYIAYLYISLFIICVLSCCCLSVALWSFCHYNKFLVCVNILGQ